MGEVMGVKMEGDLKEGQKPGQTELSETDEEEDVLLKHPIKVQTETPGVPNWKAAMTTGSHGAARCVNGA